MVISAGSRLGPYEIVAPLGAGGMGEVWRARDTRLDRSVAIKLLPAEYAQNAQLRLRLEREARAISQLNHPHICTLYDVGDGYLVMELVDGESLSDRLAKGPLPLEQVIRYGIEIAEALDRAHKAGIVHRDLKPGNIMIAKSGVKLLDFGLAKPVENAPLAELTSLRTERRSHLTEEGAIVGTFQYMAPEQLEGGDLDHRADIFALGSVLYEMGTGRRAFHGKSKASLIASILTAEPPPMSAVRPMIPAALDRVVRTCLAKEPDERFQSAHDVALELSWVADTATTAAAAPKRRRDFVAWSIAAALALAAAVLGLALWRNARAEATATPIRLAVTPPEGWTYDFMTLGAPPALSPDGMKIVFGAGKDSRRMLWVRNLADATPQMLAGSDGGSHPFWSPDSRSIGFFAGEKLKRVEIGGGAPVTICEGVDGRGGSWNAQGTIIFSGRYTSIMRVSAAGGTAPVAVTALDAAQRDVTHRWPLFLPDGRHFLYLASPVGLEDPANVICVGSLDQRMRKPVIPASSQPLYADGKILFVRDQLLMAQRFDLDKLQTVGDPFAAGEQGIERDVVFSDSIVSISSTGTLIYQNGTGLRESQLIWYDRSGKETGTVGEPNFVGRVSLSGDGSSLIADVSGTARTSNLWMYDLRRGVKSRITSGATPEAWPALSPDGKKLVYVEVDPLDYQLRLRDLESGAERALMKDRLGLSAASWSPDGQTIAFTRLDPKKRADIWTLSLADGKAQPYLSTDSVETMARIAPGGKWMAYQSVESGRWEVYVAPIPPTGGKWQVSAGGGMVPHWRSDGKELYYVTLDLKMTAVPITLGATPQIGVAQPLFPIRPASFVPVPYDQTADGQHFLVNSRIGDEPPPQPLMVVQHFDNELREAARRQ